ncbi:MAG: response regulator [Nitrospirae bacterium]|nr:response regulator [Nitrospirota bacterium]
MKRTAKKILVIDDDERHLIITKGLLEEAGHEVITHRNWIGATTAVADTRPDLVLLDINMPALSGERLSLLLRANRRTSRVPVVFYSSNDEDSLRRSVAECGAAGYICKGNISELKRKVEGHLQSAGPHTRTPKP